MKRVYLSHPYGGKPENREKAAALAKLYRELWDAEGKTDWQIVDPLEYFKDFKDMDDDTILRLAVNLMLTCDAVLYSPGWKRSRGCRYEHYRARQAWTQKVHYHQFYIPEGVNVA
jgi:hypothetical protein